MGVLRWIAIVILFYLIYRVLRGLFLPGAPGSREDRFGQETSSDRDAEELVQDPECGIYLPRGEALETWVDGGTAYFCSAACRDRFLARKNST